MANAKFAALAVFIGLLNIEIANDPAAAAHGMVAFPANPQDLQPDDAEKLDMILHMNLANFWSQPDSPELEEQIAKCTAAHTDLHELVEAKVAEQDAADAAAAANVG